MRATLTNIIRVLWPNLAGAFGFFFPGVGRDSDVLNVSEYYIDRDVAGEGLLVT